MHNASTCLLSRLLAALVALAFVASPADAHAVGAEARLKDGTVYLEAFFDDDTAAVNAKVKVENSDGKEVVTGRTDREGRWQFPGPAPGRYRVVVDAGAGHLVGITLTVPTPSGASTAPVAPLGAAAVAAPGAATVQISEGISRAEFTRFPWIALGIGLTTIAVTSVGWLLLRRSRSAAIREQAP